MTMRLYQNHFDVWVESGVIDALVYLLKRGTDDQLTELAAIVLGEVFHFLPKDTEITDSIL